MTVGRNAVTPCSGSSRASSGMPLRRRRDVDAVGAVDLQVDEAGRHPSRRRVGAPLDGGDDPVLDHHFAGDDAVWRHDAAGDPHECVPSRSARASTAPMPPIGTPAGMIARRAGRQSSVEHGRRRRPGVQLGDDVVAEAGGLGHPAAEGDDVDVERHRAQLYCPRHRPRRRRAVVPGRRWRHPSVCGHRSVGGRGIRPPTLGWPPAVTSIDMGETLDAAPVAAFTAIPEVDLARWPGSEADRSALAAEVRAVCHEIGFFQLVGHDVPAGFRVRYFDLLQAFFELPEDVKAEIDKVRSPHFRGWERVGAELTDNRTDFREQLDVSTENPPYGADAEPPVPAPRRAQPVAPRRRPARLPPRRDRAVRAPRRRRLRADGGDVGRARPRPWSPARGVRRAPAVAGQADQLPADAARRGRRQRPPRRRVPHPADAARRRRPAGGEPGRRVDRRARRTTTRSSSTSARCCSG